MLLDFFVFNKSSNISGPLNVLLSTICSNQDIVKALFDRNPEEFRYVAKMIGSLDLPEDLKTNSFDLSYFCEQTGESDKTQNSAKTPPKG